MAILYADKTTSSMKVAIDETNRRRALQQAFNDENGITPESIRKNIGELLCSVSEADYAGVPELEPEPDELRFRTIDELEKEIRRLEQQMREAAKSLEFEKAAELRDRIRSLKSTEFGLR